MLDAIAAIILVIMLAFGALMLYGMLVFKGKEFGYKTYFYNVETGKVEHVAEKWTSIPIGDPLLSHPFRQLTLESNNPVVCYKITFVADEQVIREFELNIELRIKKINTPPELEELIGFLKEHGGLRCGKLHDRYEIIVLQNDLVWEYPIRKMLPVICGEHLAQIKELDNPYDDKQQATFNDLIRAHLEPLLSGSSIEVESCRFYLS